MPGEVLVRWGQPAPDVADRYRETALRQAHYRAGFYQPRATLEGPISMQALLDLHEEILDLYAYHAETCGAFHHWSENLKKLRERSNKPNPIVFVGRSDPNAPDAKYQYSKTVDKAIADSAKNGTHVRILRRSVIALTYAAWEDQYRQLIAYECNLNDRNEIQSDTFRDLNRYRQAVLHAGGRLVDTPKVIKFFKKGEQVLLTEDHIYKLFSIEPLAE